MIFSVILSPHQLEAEEEKSNDLGVTITTVPCNISHRESIFLGKLQAAAVRSKLPMSHVSCKSVASMGACTRPLFYGALLLILLGLGWPGLQNPTVKAARLREHYIAAQDTRWSYTLQPDEQSR